MPLTVQITNKQKIKVTANPDGPIDGALRVSVLAGDGSFSQDPLEPLAFYAISGNSPGNTEYLVEGDKKAGSEEEFLSDRVTAEVSESEATTLGNFTAGVPEPK